MTKNGRFCQWIEHAVIKGYKVSPCVIDGWASKIRRTTVISSVTQTITKEAVQNTWIAVSRELSSETNDPTPTQSFTERISTLLKMSTKSSNILVKASLQSSKWSSFPSLCKKKSSKIRTMLPCKEMMMNRGPMNCPTGGGNKLGELTL